MTIKFMLQLLATFVIGAVILGLLLFLPAGTFNYWQAWVFIVVFMVSVNVIGTYLTFKDPALLKRRKDVASADQSTAQKIIGFLAFGSFLGLFVYCGLDYRFGWSPVPPVLSWVGDALVALGLFINLVVFRENSYGGSSVVKFEDQKVIATGPYALIRHPMYFGVVILVIGVPLALGTWWGLAILAIMIPVLIWRIHNEEQLLKKDLPGYNEYTQKVTHRLVPYLW